MNVEDNLSNESDPDMVMWCVRNVPEKEWYKKRLMFIKSMAAFVGKKYYFRRWCLSAHKDYCDWWVGPGDFKFHQDWLCDPDELASSLGNSAQRDTRGEP